MTDADLAAIERACEGYSAKHVPPPALAVIIDLLAEVRRLRVARLDLLRRFQWSGPWVGEPSCAECGRAAHYVGRHAPTCSIGQEIDNCDLPSAAPRNDSSHHS